MIKDHKLLFKQFNNIFKKKLAMARDFLMCIKRYLCLKLQCERNFYLRRSYLWIIINIT